MWPGQARSSQMWAEVSPAMAHMSEACTQSRRRGANIAAARSCAPPSDQISQLRHSQPVARGRTIDAVLDGSDRPVEPWLQASDPPDLVWSSCGHWRFHADRCPTIRIGTSPPLSEAPCSEDIVASSVGNQWNASGGQIHAARRGSKPTPDTRTLALLGRHQTPMPATPRCAATSDGAGEPNWACGLEQRLQPSSWGVVLYIGARAGPAQV